MVDSSFPPPAPFLSTPGEPSVPWKRWYCSFQTYLVASGLDGENISAARRRAILIHCLGQEGQRIFATLDNADSYEATVIALEAHFGPKQNVMMERYRFRQRGQRPGESTREYVAALRELVATCNFGNLTSEFVRDQLIEKTSISRIRERLLMESDTLTLERAVTIATQIEQAIDECKSIQKSDNTATAANFDNRGRVQVVHNKGQYKKSGAKCKQPKQTKPPVTRPVCANCGYTSHKTGSEKCPAIGQTCNICSRYNHFAKMCRTPRPEQVKQVADGNNVETVVFSVNSLNEETKHFKTCTVQLAQTPVELIIDLGAKVSILCEDMYKKSFVEYSLRRTDKRLTTYDGSEIPVVGIVDLPVTLDGSKVDSFPFYVTQTGSSLMGLDLFDRLGFKIHRNESSVQGVESNAEETELLGKIKNVAHRPHVDPTVKPVSQRLRRLPLSTREEVSAELKRLQAQRIIEPVNSSPWISNLVVARRKSGEIRLCVDLKAVNTAIIPDKYPLPTMEELSSEFHHSVLFTKLDLRRSYLQVPMAEDSKYLPAFITHDGVFQYRPFRSRDPYPGTGHNGGHIGWVILVQ